MRARRKTAMVVPRKRRRRSGPVKLIPVMAAGFITLALLIAFCTDWLELREVEFYGCASLPRDSLQVIKAGLLGRNMLAIPLASVRERILAFPEIREVVFKRRPFNRLDCYLMQRKPVAVIAGSPSAEVDREGVIIPRFAGEADVDLPVITGLDRKALETSGGRSLLLRAVRALNLLNEYGFSPAEQLSEIHVHGDEIMLVWLKTGTLVRLGSEDFESRICKLNAVYGALDEKEDFPGLIDLRFDRQVVIR